MQAIIIAVSIRRALVLVVSLIVAQLVFELLHVDQELLEGVVLADLLELLLSHVVLDGLVHLHDLRPVILALEVPNNLVEQRAHGGFEVFRGLLFLDSALHGFGVVN